MRRSLDAAVAAGEPLIDLVVRFVDGVDDMRATALLNGLGDDIEFDERPHYDDRRLRIGQATAEGVLRHFNARFTRVPLERWDAEKGEHVGYWSDSFRWSDTSIKQWPNALAGLVKSIGVTQPGANDEGQPYTPLYE